MTISFRPDKKFESYFESLNEKGEKTRFLNHAVGFTLSFQSVMEEQLERMQYVVEQQKQLTEEIRELRSEIAELKRSGVQIQEKTWTEEEQQEEDDGGLGDYLSTALGDISL